MATPPKRTHHRRPFGPPPEAAYKNKPPGKPPARPGKPQPPSGPRPNAPKSPPPKPPAPRPAAPRSPAPPPPTPKAAPRPSAPPSPRPAPPKPSAPSGTPRPLTPKAPAGPPRPSSAPPAPARPPQPLGSRAVPTPPARPPAGGLPAAIAKRQLPPRPGQRVPAQPGAPPPPVPARPGQRVPVAPAAAPPPPVQFPNLRAGAVAPEIAGQISALQSKVAALQPKLNLSAVQSEAAALDSRLSDLSGTLAAVRKQGYVYGGDLDGKLYDALGRWQSVKPQVDESIYQQSLHLAQTAQALQGPLAGLAGAVGIAARANAMLPAVNASVDAAQRAADQAERSVRQHYSSIDSASRELQTRLARVENMLKLLAGARFQLAAGEAPVMAVKAKWDKEGKDDPEGNLFLTDRRLVFEQRQEVAAKKILFITTSKELVQEVLLDAPLAELASVKASSRGLLGHQDFLEVEHKGRAYVLHLSGQDSKEWQALIERARSGGLDADRVSAGAGISLADLSGPLTQAGLLELQAQVNDLQGRAMLAFAKDALEDMEHKVAALPRQLSAVRAKGYLFEKSLEARVESLAAQWSRVQQAVQEDVRQQSASLGQAMQTLQAQTAQVMARSANPESARPQYMQARSLLAAAEAQAAAAEQSVYGQYDKFQEEVETVGARLDWVDWMLDALSTASFQLLPTEGGVAAAEAHWLRPHLEPKSGILFLTDQRLIFEERAGEFSVPFETSVALVASAAAQSGQGAGQDEEHLSLTFAAGAPLSQALLRLLGPLASEWQALLGRAKSGAYADDRIAPIAEAVLDRLRQAPTNCPNCGSPYGKPVVRGQTSITCDFCFTVTNF